MPQGIEPVGGWPVLIFEHGILRNRMDMLAVADSFADSGFMVVAIDLPLHGVTDPTSLLYASGTNPLYSGLSLPATGSIERTFDLDVLNNTTGAAGPDGQIDSSGANFINLGSVGHINVKSGFGPWPAGEKLLADLQHEVRASRQPKAADVHVTPGP